MRVESVAKNAQKSLYPASAKKKNWYIVGKTKYYIKNVKQGN